MLLINLLVFCRSIALKQSDKMGLAICCTPVMSMVVVSSLKRVHALLGCANAYNYFLQVLSLLVKITNKSIFIFRFFV